MYQAKPWALDTPSGDPDRLYGAAQAVIEARDRFLSVASHELKTPLTSLLGSAELLARRLAQNGERQERLLRPIQVIISQGHRLSRLITSLLDLLTSMRQLRPQPPDARIRMAVTSSRLWYTTSHHLLP